MLKLHQLTLSGFKSFVEPVTLEFAGGLTAIVGPNGCGKSNLSDAITWVLGERSAKTLRGTKMEDVIFNGSAGRRPIGFAEADLTLLADPSFEIAEEGRIVIGRRVHRTGESEYRLNGRRVRLKDVRDLLMDTGLGIRDYAVIEQGKIGMILSGKPQERRKLLEEAAGITRYQVRKQHAEVKLAEATANLLRLDDTISEVARSLRSLKRQAGAARRYQERLTAYRELLQTVLLGRWAGLFAELDGVAGEIRRHSESETALTTELTAKEADLAQSRERLEALAEELAERHQRHAELAARIEGRQEFLKGSRETLKEIAERITGANEMSERRGSEIEDYRAAVGELEGKRRELVAQLDSAASALSADEDRIQTVEESFGRAESRLDEIRGHLLSSLGELNELRNRRHREDLENEKADYRLRRLRDELAERERQAAETRQAADGARLALAEVESNLAKAESERDDQAARLTELIGREVEASEKRRDLETQIVATEHRIELLAEQSGVQAERRDVVRTALESVGYGDLAFLADLVEVPHGWEPALDLYFGELANAAVLAEEMLSADVAQALGSARGTSRVILERDVGFRRDDALSDPAIETTLADALALPERLRGSLPPAYLVRSAADAERLARRHPGITFLSRDPICARAGVVEVQGERATPGALTRDLKLQQLGAALETLRRQADETGEELGFVSRQRAATQEEVDRQETTVGDLKQQLAVARARVEDLTSRGQRLHAEFEGLRFESEELARDLGTLGERSLQVGALLERSQSRHAELEGSFDAAEAELDTARAAREQARTSGVSRRGHLDLLKARLESHDREHERFEREIEQATSQIALWGEEAEALARRRKSIEEAQEEAERELEAALDRRAASQDSVIEQQEVLDRFRVELRQSEAEIAKLRERQEAERSALSGLRVKEAELRQDRQHLATEYRDEFDGELPDEPTAPSADFEELESDLASRKATLERMGPVNALAAEEYSEQEERFEELSGQRTDVAESIKKLKSTIREINETSSERFRATFEEVNQTFGKTFQELFRGGEAHMRLLDEEDLLGSGIEITARPPGKRPQNIMLLSGGEKALTAIALLFALFRTKPSPFCILDEVDAPLDDVNTLRYVELLKNMSREVQFVLITHNKITMEAASRLYGVTMQEKGVSNLVAVELDDIEPEGQMQATA